MQNENEEEKINTIDIKPDWQNWKRRRFKCIGIIKRKHKTWEEELKGLYEGYFTVTTSGGSGLVWEVKHEKNTIYTISNGGRGCGKKFRYNVYMHYVLNKEGIEKIRKIIKEEV